MNGLQQISDVFSKKKTAFMPYVALGYPTVNESLETVRAMVEAGADILELGVPFSDPLADGPTIQAATQKALENGVTVALCLSMVERLRKEGITTPFMLMGYLNPFLAYGLDRLAADAACIGINGFIIPDFPPDESAEFDVLCEEHRLAFAQFLAPTSTPDRIELAAKKARGFIYVVSLTGVTGVRNRISDTLPAFLAQVRTITDKPLAVGFGIGDGEQAREVGQYADGVIVGSALVKRAGESPQAAGALAAEIAAALAA